MPTADDFKQRLSKLLRAAAEEGKPFLEVEARKLHRLVGGYPGRETNRMPVCCSVMRQEMKSGDAILCQPPSGQGATLTIRFKLPRS